MDGKFAVETIKESFQIFNHPIKIPLQKGRSFKAYMTDDGIMVSNLSMQPLLPWAVFEETVRLLVQKGGRAYKGNAMDYRLGEEGLPFDSIEGHLANKIYGNRAGKSVFRRISPISAILVWAGICVSEPGELALKDQGQSYLDF